MPQAPQLAASAVRSTQAAPQRVWPAGQTHAPIEQVVPAAQAIPHAPQLLLSLWVSTQAPRQLVSPIVQVMRQMPEEQT